MCWKERIIPGSSTIHFDEISRKRIFAAIDSANFSDIKLIKENYKNLKNKLGRIPALKDFDNYGEMDVLRILTTTVWVLIINFWSNTRRIIRSDCPQQKKR